MWFRVVILRELEWFKEAEDAATTVIDLAPSDPDSYLQRAILLRGQGRLKDLMVDQHIYAMLTEQKWKR